MDIRPKVTKIALDVIDMLVERNEQYGDANLLNHGLFGIMVRMHDKMARIEQQLRKVEMDEDVIEDALKDIIGYCLNALRLLQEGRLTKFGKLKGVFDDVKDCEDRG